MYPKLRFIEIFKQKINTSKLFLRNLQYLKSFTSTFTYLTAIKKLERVRFYNIFSYYSNYRT